MKITNKLSELGINKNSRILVVMPHPDDEAVFAAGLIHQLTQHHIPVRAISLTKGEGSTLRYGLSPTQDLAKVREQELTQAYASLGVKDLHILDLPDGNLENNLSKIKQIMTQQTQEFHPSHILTVEPDGIYGHPDHIATTKVVSQLANKKTQIIFVTLGPKHMLPRAKRMARISKIQPIPPAYQFTFPWGSTKAKIKAMIAHKPQLHPLFHAHAYLFLFRNKLLTSEFYTYHTDN